MGKSKRRKKNLETVAPPESGRPRSNFAAYVVGACVAVAIAAGWYFHDSSASPRAVPLNVKNPTFAHEIAPLVYKNCSVCHHDGASAPFPLMSYADVSKRAAQIVTVTQKRYMPPWLPEHGYGDFDGERRLSDDELAMLKNWAEQNAPEGDASHVPPAPQFAAGWQLGTPDLVVQMPRAYMLPAEGRDVYRNFVVPVPLDSDRYVKGIEFHAGSTRIHHAFVLIDRTAASRKREAKEPEPGWPGMNSLPASVMPPSAQFTSWQPGRVPRMHEDMAWKLTKGTDVVLQLHMQPGGKPEQIQPSIAFYFTDRPGTVHPALLLLRSIDMDIPPGEKAYVVRSNYTASVDLDVFAVLPHVHYLGKDLRGFATLPDGSRKWLFWIKDWNFNWQSDFAYNQPLFLPKGSRVEMEYTFDNSAGNPSNPSQPPKRVKYGPNSTDEMAEMWLQVLPHSEQDWPLLQKDIQRNSMDDLFKLNRARLRDNPADAHAHLQLGKALLSQGKVAEAEAHTRDAVKYDPGNSEAHYFLAYILSDRANDRAVLAECLKEFEKAVQLDRENFEALNGLGLLLYQMGHAKEAEGYLLEGLRLQPNDAVLQANLKLAREALGK